MTALGMARQVGFNGSDSTFHHFRIVVLAVKGVIMLNLYSLFVYAVKACGWRKSMQMTPVYWLYFGVAMILLEVMTPGALISLFFGLAAFTLALIVWLVPELAQVWQWLLFSALSVLYIVLIRKSLKPVFGGSREISDNPDDSFTGKLAVVTQAIAPGKPGRVELGGTTWNAEAECDLDVGVSVRVVSQNNLTLNVEAI
jgi:membrane protein implicated in regulation of membrane protease activity